DKSKPRRCNCALRRARWSPRAQLTERRCAGLFDRGAGIVLACPASIRSRSQHALECAADMECLMPPATTTTAAAWPRSFACTSGLAGRIVCGAMLVVAPVLVPGAALAQATDWPAKPVTAVVSYAGGGKPGGVGRTGG